MGRPIAERAKVAWRADQAAAEALRPDAIDENPRGQWIVAAGDGVGEVAAAAAVLERSRVARTEDVQEMALDQRSLVGGIAAHEDIQVGRLVLADDMHRVPGLLVLALLVLPLVRALVHDGAQRPVVHAGAGEDAGESVVVLRGNRVKLVVVAAGA